MAEPIDAAYFSPHQKREALEKGQTIKYPWAGNEKTAKMNASDIMELSGSKQRYALEFIPSERTEDTYPVHTVILRPA